MDSFAVLNRIIREHLSKDIRTGESEPAGYAGRGGPGLLEAQQGGRRAAGVAGVEELGARGAVGDRSEHGRLEWGALY